MKSHDLAKLLLSGPDLERSFDAGQIILGAAFVGWLSVLVKWMINADNW